MKNNVLNIAILILFISFFSTVQAQKTVNKETKIEKTYRPHSFGVNLGFTTGLGFAYRYMPNKYGVQVSFLPIKYDNESFTSVGLTGFYRLLDKKHFKTNLYLGNHYVKNKNYYENNIGFGYGFEAGKFVIFRAMVGYAAYDVTHGLNLLPTIDLALFYKF